MIWQEVNRLKIPGAILLRSICYIDLKLVIKLGMHVKTKSS